MTLRALLGLLALVGASLWSTISQASEIRVDSAGGLTTVMTDETNNLDLFLEGNPAGLVLLNTHDRLDLTTQWAYSNTLPVTQGSLQQAFSTIPRLTDANYIRYSGFMTFPNPQWAFQAAGDFNNLSGQPAYSYDTFRSTQYRGLVRSAYNAGPFCLGLEVLNVEFDKAYDPGLFNPYVAVQSGSSGDNQTILKAGLITTFPEKAPEDAPRWQAGGVFATQVGPSAQTLNANFFYNNSPSFSLQQIVTTSNYFFFGPELRFEIPNRLIIRFSYFIDNTDTDFSQNVAQTSTYFSSLTKFHSSQFQSMNATGAFRVNEPLNDKENLKIGGSLVTYFNNTDLLRPAQNVYDSQNKQQINVTLGVGLEALQDYTFGLQFKSQNYLYGNQNIPNNPSQNNTDYDSYQLALGGEQWLTPEFALRMGLVVEEDVYTQSVNLQTLNSSFVAGVGFKTTGFKFDAKLSLGQTFDINNSNNSTLLTGAGLSGTLFL